jgi:beta-glucuronidase
MPIKSLLLCLLLACSAQAAPVLQHPAGRAHQNLDGRWQYLVDPYETGYYDYRRKPMETRGFFEDRKQKDKGELIEYSFDQAPTLKVPGDWNSQSDKLQYYEGSLWMRRSFTAAPAAGKRYVLYFGAVNYEAHVYLNGRKLGSHQGGFTPFQFDVSELLRAGENSLVVKADNTRHADAIPTVNTDWWNYGGITRDVLLVELPATYIADYKVQLAKGDTSRIEGFVQLAGAALEQTVRLRIPEAGIDTEVRTDAQGRAALTLRAPKLKLWEPSAPTLYGVSLSAAQDKVDDRIGFRTIETRGKDIQLNGKPIFLRGISLHEENPLIPGRLRGAGDMRMMLQWARELNANYVRLAHYPHSETMLRLADEMGLLVWAEVPVYWTINWTNPATYALAAEQLSSMIGRDQNRAAAIVWSIGNETPVSPERNAFMGKLAHAVRAQDNTRLVAAALEVHRRGKDIVMEDPLAEQIDLVSFNEYVGWYWSDPVDMLNYRFNITADKPVVVTEFGADALGGFHADPHTRWSEEYQDLIYKNQIRMLSAIPGLRGMTPWILTDFRSPKRVHPVFQDGWNRKGLISETGQKKQAFHTLKAYYDTMEKSGK